MTNLNAEIPVLPQRDNGLIGRPGTGLLSSSTRISLTISKILSEGFQIAIIPKTLQLTNLIYLKKGDFVNVEFDILSKYVKKFSGK